MAADHNTKVRIHPAAIATIIDAHERRGSEKAKKNQGSVLGTLLGTYDSNVITVDQCFVVAIDTYIHETNGSTICSIEKTHQAQMVGLAQAATPGTVVVGWFSTADEPNHFNEIDNLMLEYYSKEAQKPQSVDGVALQPKKLQIIKPIFVRTNIQKLRCSVKENTLQEFPISAYLPEAFNMTQEEDLDNPKELMWKADVIWTELAVSIGCGAAERTALQMLNKTTLPDALKPEKPALKVEAIGSNLDPLDEMTSDIVAKIATVSKYVKECIETDNMDANTGRMLYEIFHSVPGLDSETMEKMLNSELTDLLMVQYLSQLASCQLAINDKLKQAFAQTPQNFDLGEHTI